VSRQSRRARTAPRPLVPLLILAAGAPAALAQSQRPIFTPTSPTGPVSYTGRHAINLPTTINGTPAIYATRHGFSQGPITPAGLFDDCNQTATLTNFDFVNGGNATIEAGMAEQEIAAATYVIPATAFPIKLNTAEILFAQNAQVTTVTAWTVMIWEGAPTGNPVVTESSDGDILPHMVISPPGNNALLVFQIDPGDPDQIILQDNGSHSFSIGFRIDEHNNQTQNPCSTPPPSNSNAFPTVDTSLNNGPANWLDGLNCGPGGCPANGGWSTFSNLNIFCRPSGDWIMRATWESINCTPGIGACCLTSGQCQIITQTSCTSQGGAYRGDNSTCASANCPQPLGACCFGNSCLNLSSADCATGGGSFQGNGTVCGSSNTCPTGACCYADGTCALVTSTACASQGGTYRGANSTCASANCPQPPGACCLSNGGCLNLTQADCAVIPGVWRGANTLCSSGICAQPACYPNCDNSTAPPVLNVLDFNCFLNRFTAGCP